MCAPPADTVLQIHDLPAQCPVCNQRSCRTLPRQRALRELVGSELRDFVDRIIAGAERIRENTVEELTDPKEVVTVIVDMIGPRHWVGQSFPTNVEWHLQAHDLESVTHPFSRPYGQNSINYKFNVIAVELHLKVGDQVRIHRTEYGNWGLIPEDAKWARTLYSERKRQQQQQRQTARASRS
jgi:hypothetical protein